MRFLSLFFRSLVISCFVALFFVGFARAAKETVQTPGEYGVYAKTEKGLTRIVTNVVFDDQRILYIESNKPARFHLNSIQYFIIYGKHDMQYLTLNSLKGFQMAPLGLPRFMLGAEVPVTVEQKNDLLYVVKPKGLFGRGYYALWINDSAWDFIVD
jgi:hypothetical protein